MPRSKRLNRKGTTKTFSVSVSRETQRRLRAAAKRSYGGNVSALIEAIAVEADRQEALGRLLRDSPPLDEASYSAFLKELLESGKRRRGRAA